MADTPPRERERPPRKTSRPRAGSPPEGEVKQEAPKQEPPKRRPPTERKLAESLTGTYQAAGSVLIAVGIPREDRGLVLAGQATLERAESIAEAWLELADQSPAVKKALHKFAEGSAVATLIGLHVSIILPIAASRGALPESMSAMFGFTPDAPATAQNGAAG